MSEQKFVNAMRITRKTHPLIKRHYFYFNVKWMLIFFFFFAALAASFLLPVVLPWKTKPYQTKN